MTNHFYEEIKAWEHTHQHLIGDTSERLSYFQQGNNSGTSSGVKTLEEVVDIIRYDEQLANAIATFRSTGNISIKDRLPAITQSIEITSESQARATIQDGDFVHTHLLQCDYDDPADPDRLTQQLVNDPHIRLIYRSPSHGVKAFIKVQPVNNIEEHGYAFQSIYNYNIAQGYGTIDRKVKGINTICYLCSDPEVVLKDAVPLPWSVPEQTTPARPKPTLPYAGTPESIESWLSKHNVLIRGRRSAPQGEMIFVDCPWEHLHSKNFGAKDTAVWQSDTFGYCFNCCHSHCEEKTWKDYREAVAPKKRLAIDIPRFERKESTR